MFGHVVVTSFSQQGWQVYGKRFVETFLRHWDIPLLCFHEGQPRPFEHDRLYWIDLKMDPEHEDFCHRFSAPEFNDPVDPNMQSIKFCHKIFAITNRDIESRWRIWIDADVVSHANVGSDDLDLMCPPSACLSFLGRRGFIRPGQPTYSECGFVGYRTEDSRVAFMLQLMREHYTSGRIMHAGPHNRHDSYTFDFFRAQVGLLPSEQHNLSEKVVGNDLHVWPKTVLARWMQHQKGPKRKMQTYGNLA